MRASYRNGKHKLRSRMLKSYLHAYGVGVIVRSDSVGAAEDSWLDILNSDHCANGFF